MRIVKSEDLGLLSWRAIFFLLLTCLLGWPLFESHSPAQVVAWGNDSYGPTNAPSTATNVVALAGGLFHGLALRSDGTVITWGNDSGGPLAIPAGLTNVVSIGCGDYDSMALGTNGELTMWGSDTWPTGLSVPPTATNVVAIGNGPDADFSLVLRADGTVVTWADTGNGLENIPSNACDIVCVAPGAGFSLALRADGTIVGWGSGAGNELAIPSSATNIVGIAAGAGGGMGLRVDGTIIVWGNLSLAGYTSAFIKHLGFSNIVDVACPFGSADFQDSCLALRSDGKLVQDMSGSPVPGSNYTAIGACGTAAFAAIGSGTPLFTGPNINRTVPAGLTAYFRKMATGAVPISYQWTCNGTNVPGATNSYLGVSNVQPSQAGSYYTLIASNSLGTATSQPMMLNVNPLEIYYQPVPLNVLLGATNILNVGVGGKGPFSYQWQFNGTNLPNATNSSLNLTNLQFTNTGGYTLIVSNAFGSVTSAVENLTIVPSIIKNPLQDQTIFLGGTATFNPEVQTLIPVIYQWQLNGTNIIGATNGSLVVTNVQFEQGGIYSLIYRDAYETVTNSAQLYLTRIAAWGVLSSPPPSNSTNITEIATGSFGDLGLNSDHTVIAWDINPIFIPPASCTNVIAVSSGDNTGLVLKTDGTVFVWGDNSFGQTNVPAGLSNVVAVSAGGWHELVLRSDGTVVAWGDNNYGQTNVPSGLSNAVAIAAGEFNNLVLQADGTVVAWGAGTNYSAVDANVNGQSLVPASLSNVIRISDGGVLCGLALTANGMISSWGSNVYGELTIPTGLTNVIAIAAGDSESFAVKTDGTVATWGNNESQPTNIPAGLTNVVQIRTSHFQALALVGDARPPTQVTVSNFSFTTNGFTLSLPSTSGRVYALEYSPVIPASNWTALPLVAGTGGTLTLTDPATNSPQRFYRILQW